MKIFHLRLADAPYKIEYLEALLPRMAKHGYDTVLLEYENAFPFEACERSQHAYTMEEVARIEMIAAAHGLATIPRGLSFSSGRRDLTDPTILQLMIDTGNELLSAHPRSKLIHFGGDEMFAVAKTPFMVKARLEVGLSGIYVSFANKLATAFAQKRAQIGIWSDMLIRHPQAIDALDKSAVIFYWDYWSYGERTPFVSIGGGCPDMCVLDRKAVGGSLKKLFSNPDVRLVEEVPLGHLERFGSYWRLDSQRHSAESFPYLKWFKEKGLAVVASCLPYPEKGSFLPNFKEKMEHLRWFSKRLHETNGEDFMTCLWQPHWPHFETCIPAFLAALELMENPELSDVEVFQNISAKLGRKWTPVAVEAFLDAGENFEYADVLMPLWGTNDISRSLSWLAAAGMLDDDLEMAERCQKKITKLLTGQWRQIPSDDFERFLLEDMAWRAECELKVQAKDQSRIKSLHKEGIALELRFRAFAMEWHKIAVVEELADARYKPWLNCLVCPA